MEQEFYNNFFSIRDEDRKKGLIYLDGFPKLNTDSSNALTDLNEAPSTYMIRKGDTWADVLFTNSLNLVVSERFKDLLQGFEGISFFPVNILTNNLHTVKVNYFNMIVRGKCGKIINELSRNELSTRIPSGPVFMKKLGLYFDTATWDKSDFFVPSETMFIFITKKVKEVIEENKLTNVRITPIAEL